MLEDFQPARLSLPGQKMQIPQRMQCRHIPKHQRILPGKTRRKRLFGFEGNARSSKGFGLLKQRLAASKHPIVQRVPAEGSAIFPAHLPQGVKGILTGGYAG